MQEKSNKMSIFFYLGCGNYCEGKKDNLNFVHICNHIMVCENNAGICTTAYNASTMHLKII